MIILIQTPHPSQVILFLNPNFVPPPSPAQLTCYTHLLHTDMQYIVHSNHGRTPITTVQNLSVLYTICSVYISNDSTATLSPHLNHTSFHPPAHKLHPQLTPPMHFLIHANIIMFSLVWLTPSPSTPPNRPSPSA